MGADHPLPKRRCRREHKIIAGMVILCAAVGAAVAVAVLFSGGGGGSGDDDSGADSGANSGGGDSGGGGGAGSGTSWALFPTESLYRAWPAGSAVNTSRFASFTRPSTFTGAAAFLAAKGAPSYSLPWESNGLGPARKPLDPLRVCLFGVGTDVTAAEFEIATDLMEVLAWIAPSLDIDIAAAYAQCNFGVYIANFPNNPVPTSEWSHYSPSQATAEYNYWGSPTRLQLLRISNQGTVPCSPASPCNNRHSMTHEWGHAMGLMHFPYGPSNQAPPADQKSFWTSVDMAAIAAIQDPRVSRTTTSAADVCTALGVAACPSDVDQAAFAASGSGYADVEKWLCAKFYSGFSPQHVAANC